MRRFFALAATVIAASVVINAQPPATGTIVGRVVLTSRIKSTSLPSTIYQPRAVAIHQPAATPEISHVIVSVKGITYKAPLPTTSREIKQVHEEFIPRILAVTRGSTVGFPNGDPIFHNVFSLASAASFDLGRYPQGRTKATTFNKPGVVKVYCHIHSQMSATIVVFDHPYFVTPELDGTFRLADVPVGSYSLAGWHERVGERIVPVTVVAGGTADVTLSLPVEDTP